MALRNDQPLHRAGAGFESLPSEGPAGNELFTGYELTSEDEPAELNGLRVVHVVDGQQYEQTLPLVLRVCPDEGTSWQAQCRGDVL